MIRARPEETARVYLAALLAGDSPVRAVAQHYGITDAAARQRIARARAKGIELPVASSASGPILVTQDDDGTWSIAPAVDNLPAARPAATLARQRPRVAAIEAAEREVFAKLFAEQLGKLGVCGHCGGVHVRACPRVKRIVFTTGGEIAEVEFWETWDDSEVIFPSDLEDDE